MDFDSTSGDFDNYSFLKYNFKTRKSYHVKNLPENKVKVTFITEEDETFSCIYFKKSKEEVYQSLRAGENLNLDFCYIDGFNIRESNAPNIVPLINITAKLSFWDGDVSFNNVNFGDGDVSFYDATFGDGNVSFEGTIFGDGDVKFNNVNFGDGDVSFGNAAFGDGDVSFEGTIFGDGDVSFGNAAFGDGDVSFEGTIFGDGKVSFDDAAFGDGDVRFDFAIFDDGNVSFYNAAFGDGAVSFYRATFGDGDVSFANATFGKGAVIFARATFGDGNVRFARSAFGDGDMRFNGANFGDGHVSFYRATFGDGDVSFANATFGKGAVIFESANFGDGNVGFYGVAFGDGHVNFTFVTFGDGHVSFEGAAFGDEDVNFAFANFGDGDVSFNKANAKGIYFKENKFNGHVELVLINIEALRFETCIIEKTLRLGSDAKYKKLSFLNTINLGHKYINWIDGDVYKAIVNNNKKSPKLHSKERRKINKEYANQFRMLKENFHNIGFYNDEDRAYRAYMKHETNRFPKCLLKPFSLIGGGRWENTESNMMGILRKMRSSYHMQALRLLRR